ncbi:MAG: NADH-quinone oxidoreductase subunit H [Bacteroidetes bacterium]|nr:NADH-quinone oxidoreductase subunit H [Bacteroidota bacterium]MBU1720636.1 NADH-quinone oxidoreductase subunit H [Bacteroidota bacterium]
MTAIGIALALVLSILFPGIIAIVKAKTAGRKPPSILQPLYDVIRLFRKGTIYSSTTSIIFQLAPLVYAASVATALLFIPYFGGPGIFSFDGDFVFFAYLLGIGKFMMIIGAMDTGSGFEGMGANREAFYSLLIEPAFFLIMGSLALVTNHVSFLELFSALHLNTHLSYLVISVAVFVLVYITMVENNRLPVDDPRTHLELTMVHEVMVLDNSGFDLAIIHIASWMKFIIFGTIIANFLIPVLISIYIKIALFVGVQVAFAVVVGLLESFRARNKIAKNPQWILAMSSLAIIVFLTTLIITSKLILN